jgi:hypothetical protein
MADEHRRHGEVLRLPDDVLDVMVEACLPHILGPLAPSVTRQIIVRAVIPAAAKNGRK